MITCGAGVVGTPVTSTFEVAATEVASGTVVVLCLSSLSELRVERLIKAEVIVAAPMMSAAIMGPILVRLHQLAVRDGVTT
jgi:hypothetical protein